MLVVVVVVLFGIVFNTVFKGSRVLTILVCANQIASVAGRSKRQCAGHALYTSILCRRCVRGTHNLQHGGSRGQLLLVWSTKGKMAWRVFGGRVFDGRVDVDESDRLRFHRLITTWTLSSMNEGPTVVLNSVEEVLDFFCVQVAGLRLQNTMCFSFG